MCTERRMEIAELRAEFAGFRAELRAEIAALRSELREFELRLESKIEAFKTDILNRIRGLILGATIVNVAAIAGGMFGLAKLLGR